MALNRPTFMSSVYSDALYGGEFGSWKANDGNNDTLAFKVDNSCIHTQVQADPWWAVDLGAALYVVGVLFTNRAENWGKTCLDQIYTIFVWTMYFIYYAYYIYSVACCLIYAWPLPAHRPAYEVSIHRTTKWAVTRQQSGRRLGGCVLLLNQFFI